MAKRLPALKANDDEGFGVPNGKQHTALKKAKVPQK
jgi:hypothetical protein